MIEVFETNVAVKRRCTESESKREAITNDLVGKEVGETEC